MIAKRCPAPGEYQYQLDVSLIYCAEHYSRLSSESQIDVMPMIHKPGCLGSNDCTCLLSIVTCTVLTLDPRA